MNYYIITDTHFGHKKMLEYCGRPENFEDIIKNNIRNIITQNDILIHLGDVCIGNDKKHNNFFGNIGYKTILVKGNHDKKSTTWYMNNGWDFVCDRFDLVLGGKRISFSHKPIEYDGMFDVNIHGHFHNSDYRKYEESLASVLTEKHKLLALEYVDYRPINLLKLI